MTCWLPFLDTYRTLCLAPTADFFAVLDKARQLTPCSMKIPAGQDRSPARLVLTFSRVFSPAWDRRHTLIRNFTRSAQTCGLTLISSSRIRLPAE